MTRHGAGTALALACAVGLSGCASFHGSSDTEDHWLGEDKAKHFAVSASSGLATTWGSRAAGVPTAPAAATGFSVTMSGGLIKELWDATADTGSGWSNKDLAWDLAGTVVGCGLGAVAPIATERGSSPTAR